MSQTTIYHHHQHLAALGCDVDAHFYTTVFGLGNRERRSYVATAQWDSGVLTVTVTLSGKKIASIRTNLATAPGPASQLDSTTRQKILTILQIKIPNFRADTLIGQRLIEYIEQLPAVYKECMKLAENEVGRSPSLDEAMESCAALQTR
jgi:hypothetical protein